MLRSDDDVLCFALLFCATFGIGSMSFGFTFAAAGPFCATLGVYFISACNLHASVAVSKALTVTPMHVRTFSDLGFFAFGETGRCIVLVSEWGVCFLSPIAFFIMGGTVLLPSLVEGISTEEPSSPTYWILVMTLGVLPVILIPTLKAIAPLAFMGGLFAVLADVICIGYSLQNLPLSPRATQVEMNNVVQSFGTIMFASGTAILIPPIQRQHRDPSHFVNLVSFTVLFIMSIYMFIGAISYYQFGCTASATLLDQVPKTTFARKLAAILMLLHIMLAFPVLLTPILFNLERYLLGKDADHAIRRQSLPFPALKTLSSSKQSRLSTEGHYLYDYETPYVQVSSPPPSDTGANDDEVYTMSDRAYSSLIRVSTIWMQAALAILFQSSFTAIQSFIGATAVTMSCMIMPCLCYLRVHPIPLDTFRGQCDRFMCHVIIFSSLVLGFYCAFIAMDQIKRDFMSSDEPLDVDNHPFVDKYPYCHEGERN